MGYLDKRSWLALNPPRTQITLIDIEKLEDVDDGLKLHLSGREVLLRLDAANRTAWRDAFEEAAAYGGKDMCISSKLSNGASSTSSHTKEVDNRKTGFLKRAGK